MNEEIVLNENAVLLIMFFIGTLFGSFATMASHRLPKSQDIIFKPSHCPACNHRLGFFDLFPIFSWLFRLGKCSHCGVKVSARYPLIEIMVGSLFAVAYLKVGFSYQFIILAVFAVCLVIAVVTDIESKVVPRSLLFFMLALGVVYNILPDNFNPLQIFLGPILGITFSYPLKYIFKICKHEGAWRVDYIMLLAVVGIFLQKELIITFLFSAGVVGILASLLWRVFVRRKQIIFVPALAIAVYLCAIMQSVGEF